MRYFLAICLFVLFALPAYAQKRKKNLPAEATIRVQEWVSYSIFSESPKDFSKHQLNDWVWIDTLSLFVDKVEVTNIHWLKFMASCDNRETYPDLESRNMKQSDMKASMTQIYPYQEKLQNKILLPDTTVWEDIDDTYVHNYFRYPGFLYFPLVGITKYQAEMFCAWRSIFVTNAYNKSGKSLAKKYHIEITFRLPTEKEWEILAQGKNKHPHGFKKLSKKERKHYKPDKDRLYAACRKMTLDSIPYISDYIFSHPPNTYNLHNTIGNVAEMVQEEGIAKGGSWYHSLEESAIKERQIYTKPTAWLGFRCVATVKLTPKKKER